MDSIIKSFTDEFLELLEEHGIEWIPLYQTPETPEIINPMVFPANNTVH